MWRLSLCKTVKALAFDLSSSNAYRMFELIHFNIWETPFLEIEIFLVTLSWYYIFLLFILSNWLGDEFLFYFHYSSFPTLFPLILLCLNLWSYVDFSQFCWFIIVWSNLLFYFICFWSNYWFDHDGDTRKSPQQKTHQEG